MYESMRIACFINEAVVVGKVEFKQNEKVKGGKRKIFVVCLKCKLGKSILH